MVIICILKTFNKLHFCRLFVISTFRLFAAKRRKDAMRKDEIHMAKNAMRQDEETPREKTTKFKFQMVSFRVAFFCLFTLKFRLYAWRVSTFRMALFLIFAWRFSTFSHGVFSYCLHLSPPFAERNIIIP